MAFGQVLCVHRRSGASRAKRLRLAGSGIATLWLEASQDANALDSYARWGKILEMTGDVDTVFPIATEIAGCSDFTLFDLPDGWRQTDPDMPLKINAIICDAHDGAVFTSKAPHFVISDDKARAVIAARESAEQSAK